MTVVLNYLFDFSCDKPLFKGSCRTIRYKMMERFPNEKLLKMYICSDDNEGVICVSNIWYDVKN